MITTNKPHYLLFCEGNAGPAFGFPEDDASRWRFVLENVESGNKIEAWDYEEILHPDRISLMAVIRGLEALDQPSKVTLITTNRYVARGLQYGLTEWRENDFCWEHFGSIQPIRNQDLWRRVDVALRYHEVTCRWMAYDSQQDRVDGDRRDVPIETSISSEHPLHANQAVQSNQTAHANQALLSQSPRVSSRSFSAITRRASQLLAQSSKSPEFDSKQQASRASAGAMSLTSEPDPVAQVPQESQSPSELAKESSLLRIIQLPGSLIWRIVLRADTMLVYTLSSLLCMDPKPESYRTRR